jgi:hypothetical protein
MAGEMPHFFVDQEQIVRFTSGIFPLCYRGHYPCTCAIVTFTCLLFSPNLETSTKLCIPGLPMENRNG